MGRGAIGSRGRNETTYRAMQRRIVAGVLPIMLLIFSASCLALSPEELAQVAPAAEQGAAASQVLLAVAFLNGDGGLQRDPARAAFWFEQAAIQGNAYAEERLGDLYEQGRGVPANLQLAFDWRLAASRRGNLKAQRDLGRMYHEGAGVGKNIEQAIYWWRRAAIKGDDASRQGLGRIRHYGGDAEVVQAAPRSWFERAAQHGYEGAVLLLELIEAIADRLDEAAHARPPALQQLAEDGDREVQFRLAQRYEHGANGVAKDAGKALTWYRRAAAGGHAQAIETVARIDAGRPIGVARAPQIGVKWRASPQSLTR